MIVDPDSVKETLPPAASNLTPAVSVEELQRQIERDARKDFLGVKPKAGPYEVFPVTLAHITVLQEIQSPLVQGIPVSEVRNILLECLIFVVIAQFDLEKEENLISLVAAMESPGYLKAEALKLANKKANVNTSTFVSEVLEILRAATSTQVKAEPPRDKSKPDPKLLQAAGLEEPGNG